MVEQQLGVHNGGRRFCKSGFDKAEEEAGTTRHNRDQLPGHIFDLGGGKPACHGRL